MSWSLVKRGLDLFDDDELTPDSGTLRQKVVQKDKKAEASTQRHGVQRAAKQKKRVQEEQRAIRNQLVQRKVTNALKEYKKSRPVNCTKQSIKLLKKLDAKTKSKHTGKVTEYHEKTLKERITKEEWSDRQKKKRIKAKGGSVFSDEDFEKINDIYLRLNQ